MLEDKDTALETYIQVFEDVISNSVIDALFAEYQHSDDWSDTKVGTNNIVDKLIRSCDVVGMSQPTVINRQNSDRRQELDDAVFKSASQAIIAYNLRFPHCNISNDTGYEILRYKTGQFYTEHVDSFTQQPRAVSCSFMLNDDYEGGEFSFFNDQIRYKLPKGSCIMFPSTFMYPHQILPVTKGTRYSIITWFI
jgi:predicted 2-oxoglutarate/Fe(II)-dependent dioxygenase YbiX